MLRLRVILICVLLASACRPRRQIAVSHDSSAAPEVAPVVAEGRGLLFSFFDRLARLRTVDRIDDVEKAALSRVMVVDPTRRLEGDRVLVADLSQKNKTGSYRTWIEQRGDWLQRNMPSRSVLQNPPTEVAPAPVARRRRPRRRVVRAVAAKSPPASTSPSPAARTKRPRVVMYSTSWCPSCKTARRFFASRGVKYVDYDVEKDKQAAQQYAALQQRNGLRRGVVPLIVIDGRVFQGFSVLQIGGALANPPSGAG